MIPDWIMLLVSIASPLLVAAVGGWLVAKRFYSQRWWELKVSAYSETLSALSKVGNEMDQSFEAAKRNNDLPDHKEYLYDESSAGIDEIARQVFLGDIYMKQEAIDELERLVKKLRDIKYEVQKDIGQPDYAMELYYQIPEVKSTAKKIAKIAKKDLRN